jgi:PRTRC genetic system protein C
MDINQLTREFRYNGVVLADPNSGFTLTQVRDFYANVYPEIVSADIEGPEQLGAKVVYTFRRAVGTKGGARFANYVFVSGSAFCLAPELGNRRFVALMTTPAPSDAELPKLAGDLVATLGANWLLAGDAQFVKDVDEALRDVGPCAVSAASRERLAELHHEYCEAQVA